MPEPKCEVWTLGLFGVNVVDSPLHLVDGELVAAQNAEPFTEEGEGGLRKRRGIAAFGDTPIGTPISALTSIPLIDPSPTLVRLVGLEDAGAQGSANGTSWSSLIGPTGLITGPTWGFGGAVSIPSLGGNLYYPLADDVTIQKFTGVGISDTSLPTLTIGGTVVALWATIDAAHDGESIYWLVSTLTSGATERSAVVRHNVDDGSFVQVGEGFSGSAQAGCVTGFVRSIVWWQDRLWVHLSNTATFPSVPTNSVYSIDPLTETAWTLDVAYGGVANQVARALAVDVAGDLYAGFTGSGNVTLRRRTSAGVWSTVQTFVGGQYSIPVLVAGARVLVFVSSGVSQGLRESADNGASFSLALAITPGTAHRLVTYQSVEYLAVQTGGAVAVLRNSSGWSTVATLVATNPGIAGVSA